GKDWEKEEPPTLDEEQVKDHLKNMKVNKSMGPDGIYPRPLKEPVHEVAEPLSIIFEKLWQSGEAPADWEKGSTTPIFKNGKKEDPGNYRPVSLISVPGKIMDQIFLKALLSHADNKQEL
ncbi:hypothetical protein N300_01090, partial [Calypte anna]